MPGREDQKRHGIEDEGGDGQRPIERQDVRPALGERVPTGVDERGDQYQSDGEETHRRPATQTSPHSLILATDSASCPPGTHDAGLARRPQSVNHRIRTPPAGRRYSAGRWRGTLVRPALDPEGS